MVFSGLYIGHIYLLVGALLTFLLFLVLVFLVSPVIWSFVFDVLRGGSSFLVSIVLGTSHSLPAPQSEVM